MIEGDSGAQRDFGCTNYKFFDMKSNAKAFIRQALKPNSDGGLGEFFLNRGLSEDFFQMQIELDKQIEKLTINRRIKVNGILQSLM